MRKPVRHFDEISAKPQVGMSQSATDFEKLQLRSPVGIGLVDRDVEDRAFEASARIAAP